MKVFVYNKVDSKKIATLTDVVSAEYSKGKVTYTTELGVEFQFDCKKVKSTCYQN